MPPTPDPVATEVFRHLFVSVAEEMGVTLERTAHSPNIKERRDHSCALFDSRGRLVAQAAHIPVHLGAFPLMMAAVVPRFRWRPGDVVICNDPAFGGTHLPDISVITPVFGPSGRLSGFVANRAHHADVGGTFPGSMGPTTELHQEGLILPPLKLYERGAVNGAVFDVLCRNVRTPEERAGDLSAQLAANATGARRYEELLRRYGAAELRLRVDEARASTRAAMQALLRQFPADELSFTDYLDADASGEPLPISVRLAARRGRLTADFSGSAPQQRGPINATLAVTHAATLYALICLLPEETPLNQGAFDPVTIQAPEGTLVHAVGSAAVAAGNVETSQRIVDVVLGALAGVFPDRIPAASQGTMNNLTVGGIDPHTGRPWAYYETLGGGAGAAPAGDGASGLHCHMSNTRNTPAEALEYHYPLRVRRYALRDGSGGAGRHRGGAGVIRELELVGGATASLLTDRRARGPYGLAGGSAGATGRNEVHAAGEWQAAPTRGAVALEAGSRIRLSTPGGGGWGTDSDAAPALAAPGQQQEHVVEGVRPGGDGEAAGEV